MSIAEQRQILERVSATYRRGSVQDTHMRDLFVRVATPWLSKHGRGLEIGCSDGHMTAQLATKLDSITVVEATEAFAREVLARGIGNSKVVQVMFENYETEERYDCIFATWVLTHMIDAQAALIRMRKMLTRQGLLFVVVPNVRVLSRQLARHMGLIDDLYSLTENDLNHGHRRAYDRGRLNLELSSAGFSIVDQGGLMLKFLADYQMDTLYQTGILTSEHVEGLYALGREYPDLSSALYCICRDGQ